MIVVQISLVNIYHIDDLAETFEDIGMHQSQ